MTGKFILAATVALCGAGVMAEEVVQVRYTCERDVPIDVVYLNVTDGSALGRAVVLAEGRQMVLSQVPSGSGARYQGELAQSGYVWWSKGDEGMLAWYDADVDEEVTLFAFCKAEH